MEYSRTFKGDQGVRLEMKVKVECFTEDSMREALSLIAQSSHKFYLDTAKVCKDQMASDEPDFVWKPDIKCKGDAEDFGAMSQEKFEQMLQHYLKSHPRCKFTEGNGSGSAGESLTAEGTKMPKEEPAKPKKYPCDVLMDLATKIPSILVKAAMEILENNTQAEYVELAVALLNEAKKYNDISSYAKGYGESVSNDAKALRNRGAKSSQGAAI